MTSHTLNKSQNESTASMLHIPVTAMPRLCAALSFAALLFQMGGCYPPLDIDAQIPTPLAFDKDDDGFPENIDCNDDDPGINPDAPEVCDGLDQDCDQVADNGVAAVFYHDADGDGYGDPETALTGCTMPIGYLPTGGDCNDADPLINPDAEDPCDDVDNDCDGEMDEDVFVYYLDEDGDGHGVPTHSEQYCSEAEATASGFSPIDDDCDDTLSTVYPGAPELCDRIDNDCDTQIDEEDTLAWYPDADADSYGDDSSPPSYSCRELEGYSLEAGDCDDARAGVYPGAEEVCNGLDDDCDGVVDGEDASGAPTYYIDEDLDGYGLEAITVQDCAEEPPDGYSLVPGDCDDTDATSHPGATEICDGRDNNCDGAPGSSEVLDADEDGTKNCMDETPYSANFDDGFEGWETYDFSGLTSWNTDSGCLMAQGIPWSVAYGPDLGDMVRYTARAQVILSGEANDTLGFVFSFLSESDFYSIVWQDALGTYNEFDPPGEIELSHCTPTCSKIVGDDNTRTLTLPQDVWVELEFSVAVNSVTLTYEGESIFSYTDSALSLPAMHLGVYSQGNPGGVCFDDFQVFHP